MSYEGKTENEIIKYWVNGGEQIGSSEKNENELRKLITESCPNNSNESGSKRKFSICCKLFRTAVLKKFVELQIIEIYPPHRNLI